MKKRILIVDDEMEIARYIGGIISDKLGSLADVKILYSGTKALELLQKENYDLLISDIVMPVTNGFKLLEYVASNKPYMEVILLTAFKDFDYIYRANKIKKITYIIKSEPDETIIKSVKETLDKINQVELDRKTLNYELLCQEDLNQIHDEDIYHLNSDEEKIVSMIKDYIRVNHYDNLSVSKIADEFHYASAYISKIFKDNCGIKLSQYVLESKLVNAKKYLSDTNYSIKKISDLIGYQESQSFARAFRSKYGMTPQQYRHLHGNGK